MDDRRILGLDLGTSTGWAIWCDGGVASGVWVLASPRELVAQRRDGRDRTCDIRFVRLLRRLRETVVKCGLVSIAFEDVPSAGAFMVFDSTRDPFEIARNFVAFFTHESCGFCTPCRVGTSLLKGYMDKLAKGYGAKNDLADIEWINRLLRNGGLAEVVVKP